MKISIFGDVMLDEYIVGTTSRLCPEAPVPIIKNPKVKRAAGGAANVAANVASLTNSPTKLYGSVGDDVEASYLKDILYSQGVNVVFTVCENSNTIVKRRILSGEHYVARIDIESEISPIDLSKDIDCDIAIISDYNKGSLSNSKELIKKLWHSTVLVDPKKTFDNYAGAFLIKPNEKEFREFVCDFKTKDELISSAHLSLNENNIEYMLVTLGSKGMILIRKDGTFHEYPAEKVDVFDVTGAGDVVIATVAFGISQGKSIRECVELAIITSSIAVSNNGTYVIKHSDLKSKNQRLVFTNGCFDIIHPGHITLLQQAKSLGDKLIVGLNSDDSIRRIKREPTNTQDARKQVLSAIGCVDEVIIFDEDTPYELIKRLRPDVLVKGGDYTVDNVVGNDLVNEVVIIPTLDTYSTTSIMEKIKNGKT